MYKKIYTGGTYTIKGCKKVKNAPKPAVKYFEDKI